ncbi:protein of unknown function [Rhodovastum atsumiense]|nr:protein of unknown function [Rhodovastum atsumiense]
MRLLFSGLFYSVFINLGFADLAPPFQSTRMMTRQAMARGVAPCPGINEAEAGRAAAARSRQALAPVRPARDPTRRRSDLSPGRVRQ